MKKRILFIVQLPPPVHGASVINQMIVEAESIRSAYDTSVLPLRFVTDVREIRRFSVKKIFLMIGFVFRLFFRLISFRPHLVYFTLSPRGNSFYRDALFVGIIKLFGKKLVYHLHSRGVQAGMKKRFGVYRFVYRDSYVISLSELLNTEFAGLPVKKVFVLQNGIPSNDFDISGRQEQPIKILFLSNLFRAKGTLVFLEIIKNLAGRGLSFQAMLVGADGDMTRKMVEEYIAENKLQQYVTVTGALYGEDKKRAMEQSTIFCMPSLDEAFPLVVLEAMQAGLCTVASRVGAVPEIIEDGKTGFLCEPGDVGGFTVRITGLIAHAASAKEIGENARGVFLQKYTREAFEQRLQVVIDELLQPAQKKQSHR